MKFILFFLFLFLGWLQNSQAQTRTDLPLYQAEQQKKQKTLYFLNQTLQKHEGIQTAQDSISPTLVDVQLLRDCKYIFKIFFTPAKHLKFNFYIATTQIV